MDNQTPNLETITKALRQKLTEVKNLQPALQEMLESTKTAMGLQPPTLKIKKLNAKAKIPTYATDGSAGMDLHCIEGFILGSRFRKLIEIGISVEIPPGYEGQIRPKSGLALKKGITVLNTPGTIDSDYRGPLAVILYNCSDNETAVFEAGDKIAQLVIAPVVKMKIEEVNDISSTDRGTGGFGSTGK